MIGIDNLSFKEKMEIAMEENKKADAIALKTLGFKSLDDFIKSKLMDSQ